MIGDDVESFLRERQINPPRCGFHVGAGWLPIVFAALDKMIAAGWDRELYQVKQKLGGLRIYIGEASDEVRDIIRAAERQCAATCETSGQPHPIATQDE